MFNRTICSLVAALSLNVAAYGQDKQTLGQVLDSIDFSRASIGVAKVEIFKGFRLASVDGCTIRLRNEGTYKRSKFVYEVMIPLTNLYIWSEVVEALEFGEIKDPEDFGPWLVMGRTKRGRRSITLTGLGKKRLHACGANIHFGLHDRRAAELFAGDLQRAVQMCTGGQ